MPLLAALAVPLACLLSAPSRAEGGRPVVGRASVIDGDTLEIRGQRIRLWGIDAPESDQLCRRADEVGWHCGARSANALAQFIGERTVACTPKGRSYERIVARCQVNGTDLGSWSVVHGWALDFVRYSRGFYLHDQTVAQGARVGMHAGTFVTPWEHRAVKRASRRPPGPPAAVTPLGSR